MDSQHCRFCTNPLLPGAAHCSVCGQLATGQPGTPALYVPSIPRRPPPQVAPTGLAGAVMMLVGLFLPWFSFSIAFPGDRLEEVRSGVSLGGVLLLPLALLLGCFSLFASPRRRALILGCSGLSLLFALSKLVDFLRVDDELRGLNGLGGQIDISIGVGFYVVLAGALISLAGAIGGRLDR